VDTMTSAGERDTMRDYWQEHTKEVSVNAMMLDDNAAEIDKLERPEVMTPLIQPRLRRAVSCWNQSCRGKVPPKRTSFFFILLHPFSYM